MTLEPGTYLGPYEILAAIGRGGMGEVYRARDTRLKREIAIKVLLAHVTSQPIKLVPGRDAKNGWQWHPVDDGSPRPIPGLAGVSEVAVAGWAKDGKSPLLQTSNDVPVVIDIVDFATGRRTPFKTISSADATGLVNVRVRSMSPDGQQYAFSYSKTISTLFVVNQAR